MEQRLHGLTGRKRKGRGREGDGASEGRENAGLLYSFMLLILGHSMRLLSVLGLPFEYHSNWQVLLAIQVWRRSSSIDLNSQLSPSCNGSTKQSISRVVK